MGNDDRTIFYTKVDSANRPYQLWRHTLANSPNDDVLVYQEEDEAYYLSVGKTRSRAYILLDLSSKITSEVYYLDANSPDGQFQLFQPRQTGIEYSIEHHSDRFYIVTNESAINFKLMSTPVDSTDKRQLANRYPPSRRRDVRRN